MQIFEHTVMKVKMNHIYKYLQLATEWTTEGSEFGSQ